MALLRVSALALGLLAAATAAETAAQPEAGVATAVEAVAQPEAAEPAAQPEAGAALRAALTARKNGEAAAAAEQLGALAAAVPEIADHASELRIEALVAAGAGAAAREEAAAFRARFPDSWLAPLVLEHEGDAAASLGDEVAARTAYAEALARPDRRSVGGRAPLLAALAASYERSGESAAGAERWREIWTQLPASGEAARAEAALDALAARDPTLAFRTADAWQERCRRLSDALHNEAALVSCDAALAARPGSEALLRARADLLFRMRRYPEAVAAFTALGEAPEARLWRARSLARAGRIEESLAVFDRIAAGADGALAARARFLAATLFEDTDLAAAAERYHLVAARAPDQDLRAAAQWRLAWLAWRRGDFAAAVPLLERCAAEARDPAEQARAAYWLARARERLGHAEGRAGLARIAGEEPLSYYGWRSAARLGPETPVDVASAPESVNPAAAGAAPVSVLTASLERRFQILLEAGLDERVGVELGDLSARESDPAARLAYAQLLLEAGRFDRAQRLVLDQGGAALSQRPAPGAEARWWLAWPTAYDRSVTRSAAAHGVEPALVYAIMREESGYQPDARSVVGARGLTQIMPDTGRRLASDLGAAGFDPAELYVPERNLELGAFYLSQLMQRFDGRMSAAIASYNAGPEAVARWLAADAARDDDEWVESIPYDQTRTYVKRVLRSVHVYRTLYGS